MPFVGVVIKVNPALDNGNAKEAVINFPSQSSTYQGLCAWYSHGRNNDALEIEYNCKQLEDVNCWIITPVKPNKLGRYIGILQ